MCLLAIVMNILGQQGQSALLFVPILGGYFELWEFNKHSPSKSAEWLCLSVVANCQHRWLVTSCYNSSSWWQPQTDCIACSHYKLIIMPMTSSRQCISDSCVVWCAKYTCNKQGLAQAHPIVTLSPLLAIEPASQVHLWIGLEGRGGDGFSWMLPELVMVPIRLWSVYDLLYWSHNQYLEKRTDLWVRLGQYLSICLSNYLSSYRSILLSIYPSASSSWNVNVRHTLHVHQPCPWQHPLQCIVH